MTTMASEISALLLMLYNSQNLLKNGNSVVNLNCVGCFFFCH